MTTANDLILGALKRNNVYAPGESLAQDDAQDALDALNEMLDSWSTDDDSVFCIVENVLSFTAGQYQYTVGNPLSANTFTGVLTSGSPIITGVTVPSDLIARGDVFGSTTGTPTGATIVSFSSGANTVTMSANATANAVAQVFTYTVPGDFKITRPLRVFNSFTRITTSGTSGLDYPIEVVSQERYNEIGYKGISAPWPIAMWYNPTYPLGNLYFYQNPSGSGSLHLLTDTILTNLTSLTQNVVLPQGYVRWIKWALAKELAPEYGKGWTQTMENNWKEARDAVMALNAVPTPTTRYDQFLTNPRTDAGWILYGGFR